jgi:hypothetical protein
MTSGVYLNMVVFCVRRIEKAGSIDSSVCSDQSGGVRDRGRPFSDQEAVKIIETFGFQFEQPLIALSPLLRTQGGVGQVSRRQNNED